MDFYQSLGYLIIGSRMRRLSEYFVAEINKVYQETGLDFDASWFPLFFILAEEGEVSIRDLADRIQISHSAVSQLVSNLKKRNLISSSTSAEDGRKQLVRFTHDGRQLLSRIKPVWESISRVMAEMAFENRDIAVLLQGLNAIESGFAVESLSDRIQAELAFRENC